MFHAMYDLSISKRTMLFICHLLTFTEMHTCAHGHAAVCVPVLTHLYVIYVCTHVYTYMRTIYTL